MGLTLPGRLSTRICLGHVENILRSCYTLRNKRRTKVEKYCFDFHFLQLGLLCQR